MVVLPNTVHAIILGAAYWLSKTFMGAKGLGEPSRGRTLGDEVTLVMAIGKSSSFIDTLYLLPLLVVEFPHIFD